MAIHDKPFNVKYANKCDWELKCKFHNRGFWKVADIHEICIELYLSSTYLCWWHVQIKNSFVPYIRLKWFISIQLFRENRINSALARILFSSPFSAAWNASFCERVDKTNKKNGRHATWRLFRSNAIISRPGSACAAVPGIDIYREIGMKWE